MASRVARHPTPASNRLWVMCVCALFAAFTAACGGSAYSKSAYAPQGAPGSAYAGDGMVATEAASAEPEADYDYAQDEAGDDRSYREVEEAVAVGGAPAPVAQKMAQTSPSPPPPPAAAKPPTPASPKPGEPTIASDAIPISQVLIYTAQMSLAVFEVDKSLDQVEALARSLGGFLSRRTDNQITIRVPSEQFDDALKGIASKGDVLTRNVQVEDVTEEFLDVSLRLKNARQVRERIAQLLANAKTVEESLQVERELTRLSAEIERLEGRVKYLQNRARYSTITVTFQPVQVDDVRPDQAFQLPFPWLQELGLGRLMNLR